MPAQHKRSGKTAKQERIRKAGIRSTAYLEAVAKAKQNYFESLVKSFTEAGWTREHAVKQVNEYLQSRRDFK